MPTDTIPGLQQDLPLCAGSAAALLLFPVGFLTVLEKGRQGQCPHPLCWGCWLSLLLSLTSSCSLTQTNIIFFSPCSEEKILYLTPEQEKDKSHFTDKEVFQLWGSGFVLSVWLQSSGLFVPSA